MQEYIARIVFLLNKVMNKEELTQQERTELDEWIAQSPQNKLLWKDVVMEKGIRDHAKLFMENDDESGRRKIAEKIEGTKAGSRRIFLGSQHRWLYVAAAFLIFVSAVGYFWSSFQTRVARNSGTSKHPVVANDVAPGGNIATLTLADGSSIALNDAQNGVLAKEGKTTIVKSGAELVYTDSAGNISALYDRYNTVSTPRGGQYAVVLPDGSKVWLNSASSLRFPSSFSHKERKVELRGEGYFEIATLSASGKKIPFRVVVNKIEIEVLGTHFNVMAYEDEDAVTTTLVEGSVKVVNSVDAVSLKPGQQARYTKGGELKVADINIQPVVAWKNGTFQLTGADIGTIMRQVARWYDIEVEYANNIPAGRISGEIPRHMNLSEILRVLELSGIKSRLEGRKVVILP